MSEIKMSHRCSSCGEVLQTENRDEAGYISPEVLKGKSLNDIVFCDACYKKSHYSPFPNKIHADKDLLTILKDAKASDALIVYFIDLFTFEYSIPVEAASLLARANIMVVARYKATKNSITDAPKHVAHIFKGYRISVKPEDVFLTDLSTNDIPVLKEEINKRREAHDVYLIGSEFSPINLFSRKFMNDYVNISTRNVVTTKHKGTNIETLRIPLDNSTTMYCVPPFKETNSYAALGDDNFKKIITPDSKTSQKKKTLKKNHTMLIGGLVRIDLLEGENTKMEIFVADKVDVETMSTKRANKHWNEILEKKQIRPCLEEVTSNKDFDAFEIRVAEEGYRDIGVSGLGWVSFKGNNQLFRIYVKIGTGLYGSRAKVITHANTKKQSKA